MKKLPATVVVLGAVSFFNDIASDKSLPLLELIDGVAEATASLLKLWAGCLGDAGLALMMTA